MPQAVARIGADHFPSRGKQVASPILLFRPRSLQTRRHLVCDTLSHRTIHPSEATEIRRRNPCSGSRPEPAVRPHDKVMSGTCPRQCCHLFWTSRNRHLRAIIAAHSRLFAIPRAVGMILHRQQNTFRVHDHMAPAAVSSFESLLFPRPANASVRRHHAEFSTTRRGRHSLEAGARRGRPGP